MDCAADKYQIKMALSSFKAIKKIDFDLSRRRLIVTHEDNPKEILDTLLRLELGIVKMEPGGFEEQNETTFKSNEFALEKSERLALRFAFLVNLTMFFAELFLGIRAESTGLIADSLDMFADAAVFALSFYVVGKSLGKKMFAAKMSGILQLMLAAGAFFEVVDQFFKLSQPASSLMIGVSIVALAANVFCMKILSRHKNAGAHMKASWIFLSTDIIANMGVILAGILVYFFKSKIPDLLVGTIITIVVLSGALRILRINRLNNDTAR